MNVCPICGAELVREPGFMKQLEASPLSLEEKARWVETYLELVCPDPTKHPRSLNA